MRTKQNVLDIAEKMDELMESSAGLLKRGLGITPEQLHKNLIQLQKDLDRMVMLIKRESSE